MLTGIGVNVLLPNVRGSTGYGFSFQSLDDKTLRWDAVKDACEAARYLKREGLATKTAAMGGSYGGVITPALLFQDPGRWGAGRGTIGNANLPPVFHNQPPPRAGFRNPQDC